MGREIKALLFDLDGTLVNTIYSLQDSINKAMKHFGLQELTEAETRKAVGNGYHLFVERAIKKTASFYYQEAEKWEDRDPDKAISFDQKADEIMGLYDEVCEYYISVFQNNCLYRAEAYPGMKESLEILRGQGIKLACVTNKSLHEAGKVLDHVFGENYFDYLSADDGTHPLKPDSALVRDCCEHLGVLLSEAVFVGDTKTDMETAKRAGIPGIGCVYGFRGREELLDYGADICIENAAALPDAVETLRG